MSYTVVNWRKLPHSFMDEIQIKGKLTLTHSSRCKATVTFIDPVSVTEALTLLNTKMDNPKKNPKITEYMKMCQHVTVNDLQLGRLMGETVSRYFNHAKEREWIYMSPNFSESN